VGWPGLTCVCIVCEYVYGTIYALYPVGHAHADMVYNSLLLNSSSEQFFDGKWHRVTPDYAAMGWPKAGSTLVANSCGIKRFLTPSLAACWAHTCGWCATPCSKMLPHNHRLISNRFDMLVARCGKKRVLPQGVAQQVARHKPLDAAWVGGECAACCLRRSEFARTQICANFATWDLFILLFTLVVKKGTSLALSTLKRLLPRTEKFQSHQNIMTRPFVWKLFTSAF
jgi:hypothetical protein